MTYPDLLETVYDAEFASVPNLRWTPWIGKRFRNLNRPRLLIVGESHYALAGKDETLEGVQAKHEANKEFTREIIWECPVSEEWKNRTLDNIPRIFIGAGAYNRIDFWQDVAFYNFIQRMVHYTEPPERPSDNDFSTSWDVFHEVLNIIRPDLCVFLGSQARNTFWSSMKRIGVEFTDQKRSERIGRCWSYRASVLIKGKDIPITFIQHPGKFFSSRAWHEYLLRQFPNEITEFKHEYTG